LPGSDLTIDNPEAAKVPFGVAAAIAIFVYVYGYAAKHQWLAF
jgi:hypothetical protein